MKSLKMLAIYELKMILQKKRNQKRKKGKYKPNKTMVDSQNTKGIITNNIDGILYKYDIIGSINFQNATV